MIALEAISSRSMSGFTKIHTPRLGMLIRPAFLAQYESNAAVGQQRSTLAVGDLDFPALLG
jgi:hypothetical protein